MTNPAAASTAGIPHTSASVTVGRSGQPVSIRAELDARGIDTGHRRRDSDLRGPRFLATVKDCHCPVWLNVSGPDILPGDPAAPVSLHATAKEGRR